MSERVQRLAEDGGDRGGVRRLANAPLAGDHGHEHGLAGQDRLSQLLPEPLAGAPPAAATKPSKERAQGRGGGGRWLGRTSGRSQHLSAAERSLRDPLDGGRTRVRQLHVLRGGQQRERVGRGRVRDLLDRRQQPVLSQGELRQQARIVVHAAAHVLQAAVHRQRLGVGDGYHEVGVEPGDPARQLLLVSGEHDRPARRAGDLPPPVIELGAGVAGGGEEAHAPDRWHQRLDRAGLRGLLDGASRVLGGPFVEKQEDPPRWAAVSGQWRSPPPAPCRRPASARR